MCVDFLRDICGKLTFSCLPFITSVVYHIYRLFSRQVPVVSVIHSGHCNAGIIVRPSFLIGINIIESDKKDKGRKSSAHAILSPSQ